MADKKFTYIFAFPNGKLAWSGNETIRTLTDVRFKEDNPEHKAIARFCNNAKSGWTHLTDDEFAMIVCTESGEEGEGLTTVELGLVEGGRYQHNPGQPTLTAVITKVHSINQVDYQIYDGHRCMFHHCQTIANFRELYPTRYPICAACQCDLFGNGAINTEGGQICRVCSEKNFGGKNES